jgi:hypothetical protein
MLEFPDFYGEDMLLPEGRTPAYLGQAVAILIYQDFARFRFAKEYRAAAARPLGLIPLRAGRRSHALR